MSAYFINVKNKSGDYKPVKVPKDIYIYIQQLEYAVMYPKQSKIKELYPQRFNNGGE